MKNNDKRKRLGLLGPRRKMQDRELARAAKDGQGVHTPQEIPPEEPAPPAPGPEPRTRRPSDDYRRWQEPCFFACVPNGYRPIDVYDSALIQAAGPS